MLVLEGEGVIVAGGTDPMEQTRTAQLVKHVRALLAAKNDAIGLEALVLRVDVLRDEGCRWNPGIEQGFLEHSCRRKTHRLQYQFDAFRTLW